MRVVLADPMIGVDPDESVHVTSELGEDIEKDDSIYITFIIGEEEAEDEGEVCFAIHRDDVSRWDKIFREAADQLLNTAYELQRRREATALNYPGDNGTPA